MLIKGPVFARWLYDDPAERPYRDLDLLVAPDRVDAARRTLAEGELASFNAPRVWLRLGAPWNAVVRRGTHTLRLPTAARPVNVAY